MIYIIFFCLKSVNVITVNFIIGSNVQVLNYSVQSNMQYSIQLFILFGITKQFDWIPKNVIMFLC